MTETLVAVSPPSPEKNEDQEPGPLEQQEPGGEAFGVIPQAGPDRELTAAELAVIQQMVRQAKDAGVALTGPDGLLKALTKTVIETALDEELSEHLGYDKHAPQGRNRGNSRNGTRTKTVLTDNCGPVEVTVPRDRDVSFEPQLVKKRQRRLSDLDELVLSLYAKGLTTGEISAHLSRSTAPRCPRTRSRGSPTG